MCTSSIRMIRVFLPFSMNCSQVAMFQIIPVLCPHGQGDGGWSSKCGQAWTWGGGGGAKNSQICGTDAESCQHFFQLPPTSQSKFFSLPMFPWMLILTHSFLMQPPTSLSVPSDLKNHFFKRSIFFITKVSVFFYQIFLFITFPITLIFSKILQLYLSILS